LGKKKKKAGKKRRKALKRTRKESLMGFPPCACKETCCEKYLKSEKKRCSRCPCFDLIKKVA